MAMSATTEQAVRSDINVTPLVDVCLVLLIIFMVVTPMIVTAQPVQLPKTLNPEKVPAEAKQLAVAIAQDGSILVGQQPVAADQLLATLRQIHARAPQQGVVVKGDSRVKYGDMRRLMKTISEAGFSGAALITEKKGLPAA